MPDVKDVFHISNGTTTSSTTESLLVFFITGNPGLISFYNTFLTLCYDKLNKNDRKKHSITVTGVSLRGFDVEPGYSITDGPYDLHQQISHIEQSLDKAIASQQSAKTKVVLIGHSFGSYILLEVLRRRKQRLNAGEIMDDASVAGGICLFPTVTHIAKSPSGKKFSFFFAIPYFALIASIFVRTIFLWVPFTFLQTLVGLVTGLPSNAAEVTTAFLKSPHGVRQALYLAKHEMETITADTWDAELWGVATNNTSSSKTEKTRLFFYFGTNDHWVADETRDELIAARASKGTGSEDDRPVMEIDETGIPHGFCIKHNEVVAEKVVEHVHLLL